MKIIKVLLSTFLFSVYTLSPLQAIAEQPQETVYNLVLFAQFPDFERENFMSEHTQEMLSYCMDESTTRSLSSYIEIISYGQTKVESIFSQLNEDVIVPYVMNNTLESYYNVESMMTEVISNVVIPKGIKLDGNGDGVVDNIIVVMDADSTTSETMFWPKAFSLPGVQINGLFSGPVNLQNSYNLFENYISGGAAVLCHEFLHSLGYPDLYRNESRDGIPVGQWDIMAADSIFLQYPLAYERYAVSGWLDAQTITADGNYTLSPASSNIGNRLYLLKTPLSETEFFAVEFRQKGKLYSDEMDTKIYGTGLVVYRVNTEIRGNRDVSGDEIYVFRPGETGLDAGKGDIFSSAYGGENAPNSLGSLDLYDTIEDGALIYSDGTNSGIRISDIVLNDNSASFNVKFADVSKAGFWKSINLPKQIQGADAVDLCYEDKLYVLSSKDGKALVSSFDGQIWEEMTDVFSEKIYNPQLCIRNNIPYVLYNDSANYSYAVMYYEDEEWHQLIKGNTISQYQDFQIFNDELYLAYTEGDFPYGLRLLSYNLENNSITHYDNGASDVCNVSLSVKEDEVSVSYRSAFGSTELYADIWENGTYKTIKVSDTKTGITSAASFKDSFIYSGTDDTNSIYILKNGTIQSFDYSELLAGSCFDSQLSVSNDDIYLLLNTQNENALSVYGMKDEKFQKIGNSVCTEIVNNPILTVGDDLLYVSYISEAGNVALRVYSKNNNTILGDVNNDGKFNISDIVLFQKWLLNVPGTNLSDWKAADLTGDGKLEVFDICLMKHMLVRVGND